MGHPKFLIKTGNDGKYYFNLTAKNGQVILTSQGYASKSGCENGIKSVKTNAKDEMFERKEAKNGKFYFVLKAANSQVIGKSQFYNSKAALENGIKSVIENAPKAEIEME